MAKLEDVVPGARFTIQVPSPVPSHIDVFSPWLKAVRQLAKVGEEVVAKSPTWVNHQENDEVYTFIEGFPWGVPITWLQLVEEVPPSPVRWQIPAVGSLVRVDVPEDPDHGKVCAVERVIHNLETEDFGESWVAILRGADNSKDGEECGFRCPDDDDFGGFLIGLGEPRVGDRIRVLPQCSIPGRCCSNVFEVREVELDRLICTPPGSFSSSIREESNEESKLGSWVKGIWFTSDEVQIVAHDSPLSPLPDGFKLDLPASAVEDLRMRLRQEQDGREVDRKAWQEDFDGVLAERDAARQECGDLRPSLELSRRALDGAVDEYSERRREVHDLRGINALQVAEIQGLNKRLAEAWDALQRPRPGVLREFAGRVRTDWRRFIDALDFFGIFDILSLPKRAGRFLMRGVTPSSMGIGFLIAFISGYAYIFTMDQLCWRFEEANVQVSVPAPKDPDSPFERAWLEARTARYPKPKRWL